MWNLVRTVSILFILFITQAKSMRLNMYGACLETSVCWETGSLLEKTVYPSWKYAEYLS